MNRFLQVWADKSLLERANADADKLRDEIRRLEKRLDEKEKVVLHLVGEIVLLAGGVPPPAPAAEPTKDSDILNKLPEAGSILGRIRARAERERLGHAPLGRVTNAGDA